MLRLDDGFARGRPEFKAEVRHLQRILSLIGYPLKPDGYFGITTQDAVKRLQRENALPETGEVDSKTWQLVENRISKDAQADSSDGSPAPDQNDETGGQRLLKTFRGDLAWIHAREGHAGKAYWPGGASGVTLDPGFDLGQQDRETLGEQYGQLLNPQQLGACIRCIGLKGREAKTHLNQSAVLLGIRISRTQALNILPALIQPYWVAIRKRFQALNNADTPAGVHTALLSLAYNRGANNRALEVLSVPMEQGQWVDCAQLIAGMQQNHPLEGIRKRRRMEAQMIMQSLG